MLGKKRSVIAELATAGATAPKKPSVEAVVDVPDKTPPKEVTIKVAHGGYIIQCGMGYDGHKPAVAKDWDEASKMAEAYLTGKKPSGDASEESTED